MKIRNVYTWINRRLALRYACYAYSAAFCARAHGKTSSQELRALEECTDVDICKACKAKPDEVLAFYLTEAELKEFPGPGRPASNETRSATPEEMAALERGLDIESQQLGEWLSSDVRLKT